MIVASTSVMPGLVPGIHVFSLVKEVVDGRAPGRLRPSSTGYAGHDEVCGKKS
jgi:hypothetical protein